MEERGTPFPLTYYLLYAQACLLAGITLVEVPYWWNGSVSSLQSTIHQKRPDLFADQPSLPIPSNIVRLDQSLYFASESSIWTGEYT
jgi:hypothetical protein